MEPPNQVFDHYLNQTLMDSVKALLNKEDLDKFPTPHEGKTAESIRLLYSQEVLVRISTTQEEKLKLLDRLTNMYKARDIIKAKKFKAIKVPRATVNGDYLVEQLLPCVKGSLLSTMAFYAQNYLLFDEAVVQFTEFLMQTTLRDSVGCNPWLRNHFSEKLPRYDNIKIYVSLKGEKIKYRIGLIDLEKFEAEPRDKDNSIHAARDAIILFPYQYELILANCQKKVKFHPDDIKMLKFCRDKALANIQKTYGVHFEFINKMAFSKINAFANFLDSTSLQREVIQEISECVLKMHDALPAYPYRLSCGFDKAIVYLQALGDNPDEMITYCEDEIFLPVLLKISSLMKNVFADLQNTTSDKTYEMFSDRVISFATEPYEDTFSYVDEIGNETTITVEELDESQVEWNLVKSLNPHLSDAIIKHDLSMMDCDLYLTRTIMKIFKKKGYIAQAVHEENHISIFF